MLELVTALNGALDTVCARVRNRSQKAIFRIYRDTRFSADKTPYKTHIAAWFRRRGAEGTCIWRASISAFRPIRLRWPAASTIRRPKPCCWSAPISAENYPELRRILANPKARRLMGDLQGDELTRAPKGFDPGHPAVALIKKKDWILDATLDPRLGNNAEAISAKSWIASGDDAVHRIPESPAALAEKIAPRFIRQYPLTEHCRRIAPDNRTNSAKPA